MQSYEAIRWALDRLNKENEMLNGEFLDDTFIPGIKIGTKIIYMCKRRKQIIYSHTKKRFSL